MVLLQAGSLASNICQARPAGQPLTLKLELGHREPLQGQELEAFYASRAAHAVEEDEPQPPLTPRQNPAPDSLCHWDVNGMHFLFAYLAFALDLS